jgi:hypothetical protein
MKHKGVTRVCDGFPLADRFALHTKVGSLQLMAKQLALGKPVRKQNQCNEEYDYHCNHSPLFSCFMQVEFLHRQRIF